MNDEWLSEVDENDTVIGRRGRAEMHRLQLRHRAVHMLLFNSQGDVFLQQRALSKDIHPGLWDSSAAGHVDHGESYEAAACRELAEELGITACASLRPRFKLTACAETGWEFIQVYELVHDQALLLCANEIMDGQWYHPSELDQLLRAACPVFTPTFRRIWQLWRIGTDTPDFMPHAVP